VIETDREIDRDLQVTELQKLTDGGCPAFLASVKGKPDYRMVTNLSGDIAVVKARFGWADDKEPRVGLRTGCQSLWRRRKSSPMPTAYLVLPWRRARSPAAAMRPRRIKAGDLAFPGP
jgi:hypothetical protein